MEAITTVNLMLKAKEAHRLTFIELSNQRDLHRERIHSVRIARVMEKGKDLGQKRDWKSLKILTIQIYSMRICSL